MIVLILATSFIAHGQFKSTVQLVVAPVSVTDSKGRGVDGLNASELILFDNNVPQATSKWNSAVAVADRGCGRDRTRVVQGRGPGYSGLHRRFRQADSCSAGSSGAGKWRRYVGKLDAGAANAGTREGWRAKGDPDDWGEQRPVQQNRDLERRSGGATTERFHILADVFGISGSVHKQTEDRRRQKETRRPWQGPEKGCRGVASGFWFVQLAHYLHGVAAQNESGCRRLSVSNNRRADDLLSEDGSIGGGDCGQVHRQYVLSFQPAPAAAGEFHTIRVEVRRRPELHARTSTGYWAIP